MDSSTIDVDAILADMEPRRYVGALDRWLTEDDARTEQFWALIERGTAKGLSIQSLLAAWNERSGSPCPVKYNQVRVALREREKRRAG